MGPSSHVPIYVWLPIPEAVLAGVRDDFRPSLLCTFFGGARRLS